MAIKVPADRIVDAYMSNGGNKQKALLSAGYTPSTARWNMTKVFRRPDVVKELAKRRKEVSRKFGIDQEYIIGKFMDIIESGEVLAKFKKIMPDGSLTWDFTGATLEELAHVRELGVEFTKSGRGDKAIDVTKFKIKEPDVHAALMAVSRHLGLFNDSIEVKGSLAEKIQAGRNRAYQIRNEGKPTEDEDDTVH